MPTIQATAAQATLARGLAAADIARAVLPAMLPAMAALTQDSRLLTEAVVIIPAQDMQPVRQVPALTYYTGGPTDHVIAIRDTQAQPAQAAQADIAAMVHPASCRILPATAAGLSATDLAATTTAQDMLPVIQVPVLTVGPLTAPALATADTAAPLAEP